MWVTHQKFLDQTAQWFGIQEESLKIDLSGLSPPRPQAKVKKHKKPVVLVAPQSCQEEKRREEMVPGGGRATTCPSLNPKG